MSEPVEVTNLMTNPKPVNVSAWRAGHGKDISVSMNDDGWMQLTNNTTVNDSYVYARIQLPAGAWRYGAELGAPTGGFATNELRFIRLNPIQEMQNASWDGTPGRIFTPANVLAEPTQVELRIMVGPNAGDAVRVRRLLIMTDADYTAMHDSGVEWFDGDTYPRNSGGGILLAAIVRIHISIARCAHEQRRGNHEPVHDAVRDTQNHLHLEYGCTAGTVRQMVIHDARRIAVEWHIRVPNGVYREDGRRRVGVRVLVRPTRPDDRATRHIAAAHLRHGNDRGRGRFGADGLGSRTPRSHDRSTRTVGAAGRRMAHARGLCHVPCSRLASGAQAPRRGRALVGMVRAATQRHDRSSLPARAHAIAHEVIPALGVVA